MTENKAAMKCSRAAPLLQLYVDGRLEAPRLAALEAHLEGCATCRHELDMLEAICAVGAPGEPVIEPPDLTARILARVAESEARRVPDRVRGFGLGWADALRAALLASATTLLFILLSPALRPAVGGELSSAFPNVVALLLAPGPGSIAWIAWLVWIAAGLILTLWFAGREVRALWRRVLAQRLPTLPQLRQLW
jgi:anti-sigma factor RsiW